MRPHPRRAETTRCRRAEGPAVLPDGYAAGRLWAEYDGLNHSTRTLIGRYTSDENGNRTSVVGPGIAVPAEQVEHDEQDRLVRYGDRCYEYTAYGERWREHVIGTDCTDVLATTEYRYDVHGNLRRVILPDAAGLPAGDQIEYLVDGRNRRVGRRYYDSADLTTPTETTYWLYQDALNPVAQLDDNGIQWRFVYAERGHVPSYGIHQGVTYRFVTDHLGSLRAVVDSDTGAIVRTQSFDAWGRVESAEVTEDAPANYVPPAFGFAGGLVDTTTGLIRFGARDYDPRVGRWTAKDPILFAGGDANIYAYVGNDPVNRIDPSGLAPSLWWYPAGAAAWGLWCYLYNVSRHAERSAERGAIRSEMDRLAAEIERLREQVDELQESIDRLLRDAQRFSGYCRPAEDDRADRATRAAASLIGQQNALLDRIGLLAEQLPLLGKEAESPDLPFEVPPLVWACEWLPLI